MWKKDFAKDDKSIDLSSYGNYIFLIASNKTLKSFKETIESIDKSQYNEEESPDIAFWKCFEKEKIKEIESKKTYTEDNDISNNISANPKSKNIFLEKAYKDMNYLINNINKSKKFFVKIIYFDTYLNVITQKCEIMEKLIKMDEKMNMMEKDINKLKKTNKKLAEYISKIIPGFSLSDFDD